MNHCDSARRKMTKEVTEYFQELIKQIKARRDEVLDQIDQHVDEQKKHVVEREHHWEEKQVISQTLLKFATSEDDADILKNARYILDGLENLREPIQFRELSLVDSMNTAFNIKKKNDSENALGHKELCQHFEDYMQFGDVKTTQYRS
eukprot:CAMPEP_0114998510 /NCGR_PEP_ID=MMETSP0216-20121206/15552_1 /TAXON_ID=223996 /ORGANISM="Protocruzia adherens, Strain Boccale" /LENGTH=147 /DNA_ID=CAMNT_0002363125 /DNA_START=281 /DNA_END=724 /DNA_ORIENTATION=-